MTVRSPPTVSCCSWASTADPVLWSTALCWAGRRLSDSPASTRSPSCVVTERARRCGRGEAVDLLTLVTDGGHRKAADPGAAVESATAAAGPHRRYLGEELRGGDREDDRVGVQSGQERVDEFLVVGPRGRGHRHGRPRGDVVGFLVVDLGQFRHQLVRGEHGVARRAVEACAEVGAGGDDGDLTPAGRHIERLGGRAVGRRRGDRAAGDDELAVPVVLELGHGGQVQAVTGDPGSEICGGAAGGRRRGRVRDQGGEDAGPPGDLQGELSAEPRRHQVGGVDRGVRRAR